MWADDTADGIGFRPLTGTDGTPLTFRHWYLQWLETAEARRTPMAQTGA